MKKLKKKDLYQHIDQFLKDRGIEIRTSAPLGSRLKAGCGLLTDTINHAQEAIDAAREHMDDRLDTMRSVIHAKTAPRKSASKTKKKSKKTKASGSAKKKAAKTRSVKKKASKSATAPQRAKRPASRRPATKASTGRNPLRRKKSRSANAKGGK